MRKYVALVMAVGVGFSALTGCSSSKTQSQQDANTSQVTQTESSFPPFVSTCDHGNRLYVIWLPNEPDQVTSVRDPTCPQS